MNSHLKNLTMLDGIPAQEKEVRDYMTKALSPYGEVSYDKLGSVIVKKVGHQDGPRIMVAGHMDEVGFMVTTITDEGYVKFTTAGGWWSQVMLAQQLNITTAQGKKIRGVTGAKAPHILTEEERKVPVKIEDMFIDLGVKDKEAVLALGVRPGDMVTPYIETITLNDENYYLGKAFDNRVGCAAVIDAAERLKDVNHPNRYYGVATVQEEVGLRGAGTSAFMVKPDIGLAIDTTIAYDFPKGSKETQLGNGVGIMIKDSSMIGHKGLRDYVIALADEKKIPYQLTSLERGGTDGGKMHLAHSGAPSIALCVPVRYLHSHTSIIHQADYQALVDLIVALVENLDAKTVEKITYA